MTVVPPERGEAPDPRDRARLWKWATRLMWVAAAGILAAAILNVEPLLSANDRSRWCTVWSLVERGTYQIDEIDVLPGWNTIDKVRHEGHFYSSKPPLLATLYAGAYWAVRKATGWTLLGDTNAVARVILLVTHLAPWLAALAVLCRLAERFLTTDAARLFLVATAAFGTLLTTFSVTLNNHTPAAIAVIFAIYSAMCVLEAASSAQTPTVSDRPPECKRSRLPPFVHAAIAGFSCGFAVTCELPAAAFGGLLFLLLLWKSPRLTLGVFVPAALVPVAALLATNYAASGGWRPFYAYYGTDKYVYTHEGIPSYWSEPKGLDRAVDSPLVYFLHCTIGHHGIFSLTPVWILSLFGWGAIRRRDGSPLTPMLGIGAVTSAVVLAFYMLRTENYNYGGNCSGLRWMLWTAPLFLVAAARAIEIWGGCRWFRAAALVLFSVSVFTAHCRLDNPWRPPWLFELMQQAGWLRQYEPEPPPAFDRPLTTWFRFVPAPAEGGGPWIELTGVDAEGRPISWTLSVEPPAIDAPEGSRTIRLIQATPGEAAIDRLFVIEVARFESGKPPRQFLVWPDGAPSEPDRQRAETTLRGIPSDRPYREGVIRYLKTPVQTDAYRCQRTAARVPLPSTGTTAATWVRTDLWLCDDIPFGIARIETRVTDASTGETLSERRLTVSRIGKGEPPPESRVSGSTD